MFYVRKEKNRESFDEDFDDDFECMACKKDNGKKLSLFISEPWNDNIFVLDSCDCNSVIKVFNETNHLLIELDLLERLASHVMTEIVHSRIRKHVEGTCQGNFTSSFVDPLKVKV